MTERLRLRLWAPTGVSREFELTQRGEVVRTLLAWATEIGCNPNDLDYQINHGLRIMGERSPYAGEVD